MESIVSPLGFGTFLLVLAALTWRRLPRGARIVVLALAAVLFILTTPFGANALVRLNEARIGSAATCAAPTPTTIVLLSGGTAEPPHGLDDYGALGASTLHRLFAALDLYKSAGADELVIVGTSGYEAADADIMARLAAKLGVAPEHLRVEDRSLTTWQNAELTAALEPKVARRIWLVTSALHMPRSLYAFRQAGFEACAWPAYSLYRGPAGPGYVVPRGTATAKAEDALHEIFGEIAYRLGFYGRRTPARAGDD
ncbi:MAG TPA: YdcF family protein [Rhodanobacteraceae bacterium]|nr:YdcF family protein [Rhodanobacteraceae bacterium]